ncbi:GFA family protein [Altererythrobacter sp.]|uniref:GFA family protein n=1 Tax=Altererythrobacter sp. TaxID=1872480 RepID=UPI003CFE38C9
MTHTGKCLCGHITLAIDSDPIGSRTCWCTDCQKFGGGNGTTNAFFPADSITHTGELTWFEKVADSGNTTWRAFCPQCGTHVFTRGSGRPEYTGVRMGMLDEKDLIAPQAVIWTESAPPWATFDPKLPHFPKAPPQ